MIFCDKGIIFCNKTVMTKMRPMANILCRSRLLSGAVL